jgi:hypothetical protein
VKKLFSEVPLVALKVRDFDDEIPEFRNVPESNSAAETRRFRLPL